MATINDSKCVLVTGATAGIGRALAEAISDLPSKPQVIAAGRRKERLDELASKMETVQVDLDTDKETIKNFVDDVIGKYPDLDTIVLCAGIQYETWFDKPETIALDKLLSELNINYTSILTAITYFLPHLLKLAVELHIPVSQGRPCFIIPVTSGLAITPGAWVANYSASKAALHSLSMSLRAMLKGTNVQVVEIIPPLVESELHDAEGTTERLSKLWMPLEDYIKVTMDGLKKGDLDVSAGASLGAFQKFEVGKDEIVSKALEGRNKW